MASKQLGSRAPRRGAGGMRMPAHTGHASLNADTSGKRRPPESVGSSVFPVTASGVKAGSRKLSRGEVPDVAAGATTDSGDEFVSSLWQSRVAGSSGAAGRRTTESARQARRARRAQRDRRGAWRGRVAAYCIAEGIPTAELLVALAAATEGKRVFRGPVYAPSIGANNGAISYQRDASWSGQGSDGNGSGWWWPFNGAESSSASSSGGMGGSLGTPLLAQVPLGMNPWGPPGPPVDEMGDDASSGVDDTPDPLAPELVAHVCARRLRDGRPVRWMHSLYTDVLHSCGVPSQPPLEPLPPSVAEEGGKVGEQYNEGGYVAEESDEEKEEQSIRTTTENQPSSSDYHQMAEFASDHPHERSPPSSPKSRAVRWQPPITDTSDSEDVHRQQQTHSPRQQLSPTNEHIQTQVSRRGKPSHPDRRDVFFFPFGCVVIWGADDEAEERRILSGLRSVAEKPYSVIDSDDMEFSFSLTGAGRVKSDEVILGTEDPIEKMAVSYAFAQSVRLSVFEARVNETINRTKGLPEELAAKGTISVSRIDVSRHVGALFIERNSVNLTSDFLDTPEVFWEDDAHEGMFTRVQAYLDLERRVSTVNARYDLIRELYELLAQQLENQHGVFLEWIVIILIAVEIAIEVVGFLPINLTDSNPVTPK